MQQYVTEILIDDAKAKSNTIDATYTVSSRKLEGKHFILSHLVFNGPIKITNYKEIFEIQDEVLDNLRIKYSEILSDHPSVLSIFEFRDTVRIVPDVKILMTSQALKEQMEKKYGASLDGIIAIFKNKRFKTRVGAIIEFVLKGVNIQFADSIDEAFIKWDKFVEKKTTPKKKR